MSLNPNSGGISTADQDWNGQKTVDTNGTGNSAVVGGRVYSSVAASAAVTATAAETAFDKNYTIPANSLRAGSMIRVKFQGIATATNSTDTLAIKAYIGGILGTAVLTLAARDVANNDIFWGEMEILIRTIGSAGTFVAKTLGPASPNVAGTAATINFLASTAIDTTAAQQLAVSATWSTNNAGNSCRLDYICVEVY